MACREVPVLWRESPTGLERWIPDVADRQFIAPRLGQLLGLSASTVLARESSSLGWRLFFERLAEYLPVVMVIEDLQWADPPAT